MKQTRFSSGVTALLFAAAAPVALLRRVPRPVGDPDRAP